MSKFAYLVCAKNTQELKGLLPWPGIIAKDSFRIRRINSPTKKTIEGYLVISLATLAAGENFCQGLKVGIIGADGRMPLYTSWSIFEAVFRIAKFRKINLAHARILILGASTPVGRLCAFKLAESSFKIILYGRFQELEGLKAKILEAAGPVEVIIEEDKLRAAKSADIVVNALEALELLNIWDELKPGAIVCTLSGTKGLPRARADIAIIRAGLIKLPFALNLRFEKGLPKNIVSASLAETMLLAMEGKLVSHPLALDTNPEKLEEIADIAARHKFEVWVPEAPLI